MVHVLCLLLFFLAVIFDWSIILIRKSFGASRQISGKLGVKLAIVVNKTEKNTLCNSHSKSPVQRLKFKHYLFLNYYSYYLIPGYI